MWAHYFECRVCRHRIKMVTNDIANPMRDRVGLHMSLYEVDASAYASLANFGSISRRKRGQFVSASYPLWELT